MTMKLPVFFIGEKRDLPTAGIFIGLCDIQFDKYFFKNFLNYFYYKLCYNINSDFSNII